MAELQTTLHDIAAAIVDSPDEVKVIREEDDDTITLTLTVAPDDMGMVMDKFFSGFIFCCIAGGTIRETDAERDDQVTFAL